VESEAAGSCDFDEVFDVAGRVLLVADELNLVAFCALFHLSIN